MHITYPPPPPHHPAPPTPLLWTDDRTRAPGSPSMKCGARTWHPEHTFGLSQWGRGWVGILSFHFLCCPSAEPSSGHPAQSGGEGENTRPSLPSPVFSNFSKTTSSDSSRRPEGVSHARGGGALCRRQTSLGPVWAPPRLCMGVAVAITTSLSLSVLIYHLGYSCRLTED